jgi:hypothetical protein
MRTRPPWSDRRRRTLIGLGAATVVLGAASFLPDEYGVTALFLTALSAFLLLVAAVVFVVVPGPGTFGTLLRSTALAGPALVVAELRPLWWLVTAASATWAATALWRNRGTDPPEG